MAAAGPRFKGIRYAAAWEDKADEIHNSHTNAPPHLYRDHAKFREGFRGTRASWDSRSTPGSIIRRSPTSPHSPAPSPRSRSCSTTWADRSGSAGMRTSARRSSPAGSATWSSWRPAPTSPSSSAASACASTASSSTTASARPPPRTWPTLGGPTSRPASRRSAPSAACSRATSPSTRSRARTRSTGTPSSG